MNNSTDQHQVEQIKSQLERTYIEQEIHWAQHGSQSWFQLGDKNNKLFKIWPLSGNGKTLRKIKDAQGNRFDDQESILQVITKEFQNRFKADMTIIPSHAISLSRDITEEDRSS